MSNGASLPVARLRAVARARRDPVLELPRVAEIMAKASARRFDHNLVDAQIPVVPGILEQLGAGIDVAGMGCGSGHAVNVTAKHWPNSRFTGFDFSEEAIERVEGDIFNNYYIATTG